MSCRRVVSSKRPEKSPCEVLGMKIVAIGFSNYRSVGSLPVIVNLDKRVNLLIGANNSGKSNVLEFLQRLGKEQLAINLSQTDFHRRDGNRPLTLIFEVEADEGEQLPKGRTRFHFKISGGTISEWLETPFDSLDYRQFEPFMKQALSLVWLGSRPNEETLRDHKRRVSNHHIGRLLRLVPEVHMIPQFRRIISGNEYRIDGTGVTELLG